MLEARGVSIAFRDAGGAHPVLDAADLRVAPGEVVALVGRNGAGKSTLARVMAGSLEADAAEVLLDGEVVPSRSLCRSVGFVRQDPESQLVAPDVFNEVAFGPCNLGLEPSEVRERTLSSLASCGLEGFDARLVSELSGGELQRVAIAGVLAMRPRYLVLDEVASMLDGSARRDVRDIVRSLADEGVGVLTVTHDPEELVTADRIALLEEGRIVWEGGPAELFGSAELLGRLGLGRERLAALAHLLVAYGVGIEHLGSPEVLAGQVHGSSLCGRVLETLRPPEQRHVAGRLRAEGSQGQYSGLALKDVSVSYGEGLSPALRKLSLDCAPGTVTLLAGRSGSGKSTLAHVASGLLAPDAGEVGLDGGDVAPGKVGLCLQRAEDQLFCDTLLDDVCFGPRNLGCSAEEAGERAEDALTHMGLAEELWGRSPFALSGGQRRRGALAGVMAMRPAAYVLDEPTIGLDAQGRDFLHARIRALAEAGHAVLVVSHDLAEWLDVADEVVLLRGGAISWQGAARELAEDPGPLEGAGIAAPLWLRVRWEVARHA